MSDATDSGERPFLDHLEAYLSRRDGIDKLLKILRYSCRLFLASSFAPSPKSELAVRLKEFETSVGVSRKAFRLGKFVQDLNALRTSVSKTGFWSLLTSKDGVLELVAYGGEGIYYFVEQFVWLTKAGLLHKRNAKQLQKVSAWAEFVGYFGSVVLKYIQVSAMLEKEQRIIHGYIKKAEEAGTQVPDHVLWQLRTIQTKRFMKTLSIIQDFADALLALSDIRDGKGRLSGPFLLNLAGLVSALISTHKNWLNS